MTDSDPEGQPNIEIFVNNLSDYSISFDIEKFAKDVISYLKLPTVSLDFTFLTDELIHELNNDYLGHDYPTDIITFELSDGSYLEADIYISLETTEYQAKELNHSFETELKTLIIHGILHCCQYDDKTTEEKERMFAKQNEILEALNVI